MSNNLSIYYQNVRGMRSKLQDIYKSVLSLDYEIIILTETWLNCDIFDAEIFDDRYQVFRRDRQSKTMNEGKEGGGVLIAVQKCFDAYRNSNLETLCEDLWVTIELSGRFCRSKLHLCAIYLPPPVKMDCMAHLTSKLEGSLDYLNNVFMIGDFNLNQIDWQLSPNHNYLEPQNAYNNVCTILLDFANSICLRQFNNVRNCNNRILDLIFSNSSYPISVTAAFDNISKVDVYHPPLQIDILCSQQKLLNQNHKTVFKFHNADYGLIIDRLNSYDWTHELDTSKSLEENTEKFYNIINNIITELVPKKQLNKNKYPIWYSKNLIRILKEKEKCRVKMKKFQNKLDEFEYNLLKKRTNLLIHKCYTSYIINVQNNVIKNPKYFWSYIKAKSHNKSHIPQCMKLKNKEASDGQSIANLFCEHFASIYKKPQKFDEYNYNFFNEPFDARHLSHLYILEPEIEKRLKCLNASKGCGSDGIPPIFLMRCAEALSKPLNIIFNQSLREGIFPKIWKEAMVVPIPKTGDKQLVENYRPICMLPVLAKVFEKLVSSYISWHIKQNLSDHQHGFIAKRSTSTNLMSYVEKLLSYMGTGAEIDAIYNDLSKAFDRVDHNILLHKLKHQFNIDGPLLKWLESYLKDRRLKVVVNGFQSECCVPSSGVPQGSILGPILFGIFVDDIKYQIQYSEFQLYADDLKLFRVVQNAYDQQLLQMDIDSVSNWCKANSMDLNTNKSLHIKFSRKRTKFDSCYNISNTTLKKVSEVKDLGVIFDTELRFECHVNNVIKRGLKMLGFINRNTKEFKNVTALKNLYSALVRSHIDYCSIVWYPSYQNNIQRLEKIQRRFIGKLSFITNIYKNIKKYEDRLQHFNFITLYKRNDIQRILFLFKICNQLIDCPFLLSRVNIKVPRFNARLSSYIPLYTYHNSAKYVRNSPLNLSFKSFNAIFRDSDIDIFADSIGQFKKKVYSAYSR